MTGMISYEEDVVMTVLIVVHSTLSRYFKINDLSFTHLPIDFLHFLYPVLRVWRHRQ